MNTAFAQIVTAIIDVLRAGQPVCGLIDRARATVVPDQAEMAVSVQWENTAAQGFTIAGAPIDWQTRITIECLARSARDPGDLAVDPLLRAVTARLAADTTLGGLVDDLRIAGIEAENDAQGKKTGWVRIAYVADHRTSNSTLN